MYRKDVLEKEIYRTDKKDTNQPRPNFAAIARDMGCDYRTAKKAYERARSGGESDSSPTRRKKPSKLDPFKAVIAEKLAMPCSFKAIFLFIGKQGCEGGYTIPKECCNSIIDEMERAAVMRFETRPGLQAQIDWKERMALKDRSGKPVTFNIFLMVMGYSRAKYVELTLDRSQPTLMRCILRAIAYFGGSPKEMLFDSMRTVADRSQGEYGKGVVNAAFDAFARDCGFEPVLCKAFHPYTKGKAEDLAKLTERLGPYNGEFSSAEEMSAIVASGKLYILLGADIISTHPIGERMFNYDKADYEAIMKSKAFRDVPDDQIEAIAEASLGIYDLIEKGGVWAG